LLVGDLSFFSFGSNLLLGGFMTLQALPWYTLAMVIFLWMLDKATEDLPFRQKRKSSEFFPENHPVVPTPKVGFWQRVNNKPE
jgi:hypothetical protein